MNINIVLMDAGLIVPKMAHWLEHHLGWNINDTVDHNADVNYFMPYLQYKFDMRIKTLTTAWFTHYEKGTHWKTQKWLDAAIYTSMQLITSPLYTADSYGLTNPQKITPGVDLDFFIPKNSHKNKRPILGIAGEGQPRKGIHLILDLYYSGLTVELQIVGRNWPFYHVYLADEALPGWYNSLDVYVCTSLIEGIPAPVLEALACDTKIVVPTGVGICDELPEMEGIRHYTKGDSQEMVIAIQKALQDKPSKGALRDVAKNYSIEAWCLSHKIAMEELINAKIFV